MGLSTSNRCLTDAAEDDDRPCVARCKAGDAEAFGVLVRKYQQRLYTTVRRMLSCDDDARDVVQETFVRAYQALAGFNEQAGFYTWLYRIAVNTAISCRRREKRHREELTHRNGRLGGPARSGPADCMEQSETARSVRQALERLPEEQRTVLVLREFDGRSYEEIASLLSCPVGTVRSRLFRARMELRELLKPLVEGEGLDRPMTQGSAGASGAAVPQATENLKR